MLGMNAFAGSIVFGELGLENGVQYTDPFDGGDFTVTFAGGGNDGKYYNTGSGIRVYGGGTMTIAAKSGTLKKIVITYDGANKPESADVVSVGTYDPATGIWTGDAAEVVFTRPSGSGHWRVKKIEVGDDAQGPELPTEGQKADEALTVARALEIISTLDNGKSTDYAYYVKGKVKEITYKGTTFSFTMADSDDATDLLTVYKAKGLENKDIIDQEFIKEGDEVVVYGVLQKYVKDEAVTPELSSGYVYSVNGNSQGQEIPEPTIDGGTTPETAISVSAAISAINTMVDGQTTKDSYYISGVVVAVSEISTGNGNATFTIGETQNDEVTLTVYRAKGLQQKDITDEEYLKQGDAVVVYGKLQKYVKNDVVTPELAQGGYIYSLNGKTEAEEKPIVLEGDGTEQNPYTVGDMRQLPSEKEATEGQERIWVKGIIVGCLNSAGSAFLEGEALVASNIALGASAGDTEAAKTIPVQLPTNAIREALNVVDNPGNVGKEVIVYGQLLKYMGRTGVKNVTDFILDGKKYTDGIAVVAADKADSALYNLAGQRVEKAVKGLYIQNGRKFVVK